MSEESKKIPLPGEHDAKPQAPDFLKADEWFDIDISGDLLDFAEPYRPPRYTMERDGVPFADVGELHIISGKPGHGKTGLMSQLMATVLCGQHGNTVRRSVPHLVRQPDGSQSEQMVEVRVLYIDTEQGKDDTIAIKNRVCSMAGIDYTKPTQQFTILRLRDTEEAKDRWRKILKAIHTVRPTDIFLDGMLDIVKDYNDQTECQPIVRRCMMTATEYDASLWAVLHENPMVDKLVGTLGSITQRKVSEIFTVIKVKQADLKPNEQRPDLPDIYFKVKQVKARGRDVGDWLFEYVTNAGGWGQPVEIQDNGAKVVDSKEIAFMKEADERLKAFNWTSSGATYTELERYLRKSVSGRRAGDLINAAAEHGIIYKSDKKKYHYRGIKELPKDPTQDLPFDKPNGEEPDF
ncbi:MAG: AAA family ATPase [Bacteroidaceae bacterium]|nr:AAA family ATPase [Bacteroidaceae bacterium]